MKTQHNVKTKRIRVDNGGEFTSNAFKEWTKSKGIKIEYTMPYTPQQNGKAERMNLTLMNRVRTKFAETQLPKHLWGVAIQASAYELNRCPTSALNGDVPARIWYGYLDLKRLRVFGCRAWKVAMPRQGKLEPRAKQMIFVGYHEGGYKLWDPQTKEMHISRDVIFDETQNKYTAINSNTNLFEERKDDCYDMESPCHENKDKQVEMTSNEETSKQSDNEIFQEAEEEIQENNSPKISRSGRVINKPRRYIDEEYIAYCMLTQGEEIRFEEAQKDKERNNAIKKELDAHDKMKTWTVCDLPKGKKTVEAKWIFKEKDDNTKKARLVARGFQLKEDAKYDNHYAPVARMSTVRMLLSHAMNKDWKIKQLDIPTAFLNGKLDSEVYLKVPEGVTTEEGKVLKLNRGLYGLKESPKCWNRRFDEFAQKNGLKRSNNDFCFYIDKNAWLVIFVDDIFNNWRR